MRILNNIKIKVTTSHPSIMKHITCKTILLLLVLLNNLFQGQESNNKKIIDVFPPAPESSKLIKDLNYRYNGSNGVQEIQIPIHKINLKGFSLPVELNYNYSGLKVNDINTSTGIGWSLSIGGKIAQMVSGKNDLEDGYINNGVIIPENRPLNPYAYVNSNNAFVRNDDYNLLKSITGDMVYSEVPTSSSVTRDTKPDVFYYSLAGKSGKFFLTDNFKAYQIPAGKEKIEYFGFNAEFVFTITDTEGNKFCYKDYEMSTIVNADTSPIRFVNGTSFAKSYTFLLNKIITNKGDVITFNYENEDYEYTNDLVYNKYKITGTQGDYSEIGQNTSFEKITTSYSIVKGKRLDKVFVNNILYLDLNYTSFNRPDVKSSSTNPAKFLKEILVFNNYQQIDKVDFEWLKSSFSNWYVLNSVKQKSQENPYSFEYYDLNTAPDRLTDLKDDWGYFNTNGSRYKLNEFVYEASNKLRKPNLESTIKLALKKVVYPTKGYEEYDYELNSYYDPNYSEFTIVDNFVDIYPYDSSEDFYQEKDFEINSNGFGNALISYCLGDFSTSGATTNQYVNISILNEWGVPVNHSFSFGGFKSEEINLPVGKYKLILNARGYDCAFVTITYRTKSTIPVADKNIPAGGLRQKQIRIYDHNNQLVRKKNFNYDFNGQTSGIVYDSPRFTFSENINSPKIFSCNTVANYLNANVLSSNSISDILGFNGSSVFYSKVEEIDTDASNLPKGKTVSIFSYKDDIGITGVGNYTNNIKLDWMRGNLVEKQIYRFANNTYELIKTEKRSYETQCNICNNGFSSFYETSRFPNEYHRMAADVKMDNMEINYLCVIPGTQSEINIKLPGVYTSSVYKLISAPFFLKSIENQEYFGANTIKTIEQYSYDNPNHMQSTSVTTIYADGTTSKKVLNYAHEKGNQKLIDANMVGLPLETITLQNGKPLSKVETIYPTALPTAQTGSLLLPLSVQSTKVNTISLTTPPTGEVKDTELTFDKYDSKGNILQYTPKSGIPTTIIWGYNQTQPVAKIEGIGYDALLAISGASALVNDAITKSNADKDRISEDALIVALNTLRNNSNLSGYQITTYTYDPLIGVTSVTPPSGIMERYFYDTANRLEKVIDVNGNILKEYKYNYKQ